VRASLLKKYILRDFLLFDLIVACRGNILAGNLIVKSGVSDLIIRYIVAGRSGFLFNED